MFKKFSKEESFSNTNQVKSSVIRNIRRQLCDLYPWLEESGTIDSILPKKEPVMLAKCQNHIQILYLRDVPLCFCHRDGPWFLTLRLVHRYPQAMPRLRTDLGAIRFVLSGANIMCPGLTSEGATIHDELEEGKPVSIYGEGKEHAMALGIMTMSTEAIRTENKGIGVEVVHYLNDGLWKWN